MNELLSSYQDLGEIHELVLYLLEKEIEEQLWDVWVHKDIELSFEEFKSKAFKRGSKAKELTEQEEEEIMRQAQEILNFQVEEAENVKID